MASRAVDLKGLFQAFNPFIGQSFEQIYEQLECDWDIYDVRGKPKSGNVHDLVDAILSESLGLDTSGCEQSLSVKLRTTTLLPGGTPAQDVLLPGIDYIRLAVDEDWDAISGRKVPELKRALQQHWIFVVFQRASEVAGFSPKDVLARVTQPASLASKSNGLEAKAHQYWDMCRSIVISGEALNRYGLFPFPGRTAFPIFAKSHGSSKPRRQTRPTPLNGEVKTVSYYLTPDALKSFLDNIPDLSPHLGSISRTTAAGAEPDSPGRTLGRREDFWSDGELKATLDAYMEMLDLQRQGRRFNKARFGRELRAGPVWARTKGSIEFRMQNISHVRAQMGLDWVEGYKPAANVGIDVERRLRAMMEGEGSGKTPASTRIVWSNRYSPPGGNQTRPPNSYEVDPDAWDRGRTAHSTLQTLIRDRAEAAGLKPVNQGNPDIDVGWQDGSRLVVVEVKSIAPRTQSRASNETTQIRLGIGQLLDYVEQLRAEGHPVDPVLAVEREPDQRWSRLCSTLGIRLVWPDTLDQLFAPST